MMREVVADDQHGVDLGIKLALPEDTAPDDTALFSSSLRIKSSRNITHKVL